MTDAHIERRTCMWSLSNLHYNVTKYKWTAIIATKYKTLIFSSCIWGNFRLWKCRKKYWQICYIRRRKWRSRSLMEAVLTLGYHIYFMTYFCAHMSSIGHMSQIEPNRNTKQNSLNTSNITHTRRTGCLLGVSRVCTWSSQTN